MEPIKAYLFNDHAEWRFKDFEVIGIVGQSDIPLSLWKRICVHPNVYWAGLKKEEDRKLLAGFRFETPLDISCIQGVDGEDSFIVTQGTRDSNGKDLADFVADSVGLKRIRPFKDFVDQLSGQIQTTYGTYLASEDLARQQNIPLEQAFGRIYFTTFLNSYEGIEMQEAIRKATDTFR